jgi:hypothetical protein
MHFILRNCYKKCFELTDYDAFFKKWCKKYTNGNFTFNKPVSGNVPGEITVIYTFYNDEKNIFLRVFAFCPKFFVIRTGKSDL